MVLDSVLAIIVQQFGMDILQAGMKLFEGPKQPKRDDSIRFECPDCKLVLQYPEAITKFDLVECTCGFVFPVVAGFWRCDCGTLTRGIPVNGDVSVCETCDLLWNTRLDEVLFLCRCRFVFANTNGEPLGRTMCCDKTLYEMYQIPQAEFLESVKSVLYLSQRLNHPD